MANRIKLQHSRVTRNVCVCRGVATAFQPLLALTFCYQYTMFKDINPYITLNTPIYNIIISFHCYIKCPEGQKATICHCLSSVSWTRNGIGPSGLRGCHGTKCPLLTVFFLFLLLSSAGLLFSQKGLLRGSEILHGVLTHKKIRVGGEEKHDRPPLPRSG